MNLINLTNGKICISFFEVNSLVCIINLKIPTSPDLDVHVASSHWDVDSTNLSASHLVTVKFIGSIYFLYFIPINSLMKNKLI